MLSTHERELKEGKIGVIPTDTLYGVVASSRVIDAVDKIYRVRNRATDKPCIVLISDTADLSEFGIELNDYQKSILEKAWPGAVSVIFPVTSGAWEHVHRGQNSIAFRVPEDESLRKCLSQTGPLIAPSANKEGEKPAQTIEEAKTYFGDTVDFYCDGGVQDAEPSAIIKFAGDSVDVIRGKFDL
ncbi:threonylcarbamoyl-AMP synthase [Candidatus Wolfebacteria bacterium]|nr:MAG: threonylcarbamoyl-AMP synthase [Candidatus Wolfebacteria bacterium]